MMKPGKYENFQMGLFDEWECSQMVKGTDVFSSRNGLVRREWLSGCRKERALTQDLMSEIADLKNLDTALRRVISNKGGAGIDGMSVEELNDWFSNHYRELQHQLRMGTYRVTAVKEVWIRKPNGGERQLGIPTVKDRLVQQAISQVLSKRYNSTFSDHSYGFRPQRNAHQALRKAGDYVAEGKNWIVDIDLAKFFDEVNHDRLLWQLGTRIGDKYVLKLIGKFLRAGMLSGGMTNQRVKGTPQGSPLSPLLSNIVLDELDKELERRGHCFVRYADDIIIMVGSELASERVMKSLSGFIGNRMRLKINKEKSKVIRPHELNFLGHSILKDGSLGLSRTSEQRLRAKLKQFTNRNRGISFGQLISELNTVLRGWLSYFKNARMKSRLGNIDGWIRRRLRCYRLKQCKRALGIARLLTKLGVPWHRSWTTAGSSKGWFRLSMTHAAHEGMNLEWFKKAGLYSLTANYG
ncbi:MAG: group II intron reverse transcriptase/maturase [Bacteroidales bacterium]|nr:group II intron reverse transcriptase/maturase [Bacteroidales bacterium]